MHQIAYFRGKKGKTTKTKSPAKNIVHEPQALAMHIHTTLLLDAFLSLCDGSVKRTQHPSNFPQSGR